MSTTTAIGQPIVPWLALLALAFGAGCGASEAVPDNAAPDEAARDEATLDETATDDTATDDSLHSEPDVSAACTQPYECTLRPRGCCPPCGELGVADVAGVLARDADAFTRAECAEPTACPACQTEGNPSLVAMCRDRRCTAVDLRAETLTLCATDDDCVLISRDCCACDPGHVAVSAGAEADYYRQTCGEQPICSPCQRHEVPASLVARCEAGHCAVRAAAPPHCEAPCRPVDQHRCQPSGEPCTCGYVHQPFADCRPGPNQPCPSARAFTVACDPRCCAP